MGKKFDIRQWVLITSIRPLTIWLWKTPYLRFTAQDYNPANAKNVFQHLTNASISKHNGKARIKKQGIHVIKDNMWETHQMQAFLADEFPEDENAHGDESAAQDEAARDEEGAAAMDYGPANDNSPELNGSPALELEPVAETGPAEDQSPAQDSSPAKD